MSELNGKKMQQQWAKDVLKQIIILMKDDTYNGNFLTEGYKYTINAVFDNYSQTYYSEGEDKNVSIFHRYNEFNSGIYKNVLMSKNAFKILDGDAKVRKEYNELKSDLILTLKNFKIKGVKKNSSLNTLMEKIKSIEKENKELHDEYMKKWKECRDKGNEIKQLKDDLHGEHLTPQSYSRKILNDLLVSLQKESKTIGPKELEERIDKAINLAFLDCKICILTKEESDILDGSGNNYSDDDMKEIEKYIEKIGEKKDIYKSVEFIGACKKLKETGKKGSRKKTDGFGSIRMFLLEREGVKFVDSDGKELEDCLDYLNDGVFTIPEIKGKIEFDED